MTMTSTASSSFLKARTAFIRAVSSLTGDHHGQVNHAAVYGVIMDYQRLDPSFSDEQASVHAWALLYWTHNPDTAAAVHPSSLEAKWKAKDDDLRQKIAPRMEPFIVCMRERVKDKTPGYVELSERLHKLGILKDVDAGNSSGLSDESPTLSGKKRLREESTDESSPDSRGGSDGGLSESDDATLDDPRQSKLRRVTTSADVKRVVARVWGSSESKFEHHRAEDRCNACKNSRNTICAIKPGTTSCAWCRLKKKRCIRIVTQNVPGGKTGENVNGKGKGKEREPPLAMRQTRKSAVEKDLPRRSYNSGHEDERIDTSDAQEEMFGHPRDATVLQRPRSAVGDGLEAQPKSTLEAESSQSHSSPSRSMAPPELPQPLPLRNATPFVDSPDTSSAPSTPEINRLTTSYFQRTQRYIEMQTRYTTALAGLLPAYDELMADADKLSEADLLPEVFRPKSVFKGEAAAALLIGRERYRRDHPGQWRRLVSGCGVPVEAPSSGGCS